MSYCKNCENEINPNDDYCSFCGILFTIEKCENHEDEEAEGVCLVCGEVCCTKCGRFSGPSFLCNKHSDIEVFQSMGRVYGSSDSAEVDYLISVLEQNGFHPFKFNRKNNSISLGGSDFSLFRASGEYNGHIINEIKILVPLPEYLEAEKLLNKS